MQTNEPIAAVTQSLVALGQGQATKYSYDRPNPALLEAFYSPANRGAAHEKLSVRIEAPEFTSLCPITGQPDFAVIVINYEPHQKCVESKSLKLYLGGYRMFGEFHEACVTRIGRDLVTLLEPHVLTVEGRFTPRGGIPFWPTYRYVA